MSRGVSWSVRPAANRLSVCLGGGPHGHPRIFINVDKPEIVPCGYCGLPFVGPPFPVCAVGGNGWLADGGWVQAHVHSKSALQKLEKPSYPLE